jgi:hypothetical protein
MPSRSARVRRQLPIWGLISPARHPSRFDVDCSQITQKDTEISQTSCGASGVVFRSTEGRIIHARCPRDRRRSGRNAEAFQDLPDGLRRMDGTENPRGGPRAVSTGPPCYVSTEEGRSTARCRILTPPGRASEGHRGELGTPVDDTWRRGPLRTKPGGVPVPEFCVAD